MASQNLKQHKVKKGENLTVIAKKYHHKDWKPIWDAPENKQIAKSRGAPEKIQPGDVLVIPLNEQEKKEVCEQQARLQAERDAEVVLQKALNAEALRFKTRMQICDALSKAYVSSTQRIVDELRANKAAMKKWGEGVDVAKELATMGVNLGKLASTGAKASQAAGDALERLNKQAAKEATDMLTDPLKNQAVKAAATLKDKKSWVSATVGILADSWDKMTSPSFWAHTYVQMTENGKSWSEAVTMDIGEDIDRRIKEYIQKCADDVGKLKPERKDVEKRLSEVQGFLGECAQRIKAVEANASELPRC